MCTSPPQNFAVEAGPAKKRQSFWLNAQSCSTCCRGKNRHLTGLTTLTSCPAAWVCCTPEKAKPLVPRQHAHYTAKRSLGLVKFCQRRAVTLHRSAQGSAEAVQHWVWGN